MQKLNTLLQNLKSISDFLEIKGDVETEKKKKAVHDAHGCVPELVESLFHATRVYRECCGLPALPESFTQTKGFMTQRLGGAVVPWMLSLCQVTDSLIHIGWVRFQSSYCTPM